MSRGRWLRWVCTLLALLGTLPAVAVGQVTTVRLAVERGDVGLAGFVRGGSWAPLRVTLHNDAAEPRAVICRWVLNDADGDEVVAQRTVTINPNRPQSVWLYGVPPANVGDAPRWRVEVVDPQRNELLAGTHVTPGSRLANTTGAIGVFGTAALGLDDYARGYTQHEPVAIVRGLSFPGSPDRWYGLDLLQSLVWTRLGGGPEDPAVSTATLAAVREWVRRGGHLVIVMPEIDDPWRLSRMADMLPVGPGNMRRIEGPPPRFLYDIAPVELDAIGMTAFDNAAAAGAAVLQRDAQGNALIVAKRYGFGRVTLVGIDLTDPRLTRLGIPHGSYRIWNTIYGWNGPVIPEEAARARINEQRLSDPRTRVNRELGQLIPPVIGMTGTVGMALLLVVAVFAIYFAATPLSFVVLKQRNLAHRAWLAFVVIVFAFTAVAWGGAWLMRPGVMSIAHFSVLDVDARTGEVRTHSWLSLYVPDFGRATIAVGDPANRGQDVIWSPGLFGRLDDAGFPDTETYTIDAAAPHTVAAPMRATAKQFTVRFQGRLDDRTAGVTAPWVTPQGSLRVDQTGFPSGTLQHNLPGTLTNVLIVFVPATGADPTPWVWRIGEWAPMTPLEVAAPAQMGQPADRLVRRPPTYEVEQRNWRSEGFLGDAMSRIGGASLADVTQHNPFEVSLPENTRIFMFEMLSFYDALPPPDYVRPNFGINPPVSYSRALGRTLDLTPLTVGGRVIIIGHLPDSPLPMPLTVDGYDVPSNGRTVVRWIYDL
jgi:hypothetical protein